MISFTRPRRVVVAAVATACAAVLSTTTASATPADGGALPTLLTIDHGVANLCLDPTAQNAFGTSGITMSAGAPAQLTTVGPQPCATTYVTEGAVSLGLTGGDFPFHGTISFTRSSDNAKITFSDIAITFSAPGTITAAVNGDTAHPVTLVTFVPLPDNIMTDGSYLIAHDVPMTLTQAGASAFEKVFGTSPVASGSTVLVGTGYGRVKAGSLPLG